MEDSVDVADIHILEGRVKIGGDGGKGLGVLGSHVPVGIHLGGILEEGLEGIDGGLDGVLEAEATVLKSLEGGAGDGVVVLVEAGASAVFLGLEAVGLEGILEFF